MILINRFFYPLFALLFIGKAWALDFEDYEKEMKEKNLPLTLIVGCGHKIGHAHKDSWCVDLAEYTHVPPSDIGLVYDPVTKCKKTIPAYEAEIDENGNQVPHWKYIGADAELNIKGSTTGSFLGNKYTNKFDIIVLERSHPTSLESPFTLYNALSMLKVGGELIVDQHSEYNNYIYYCDGINFKKEFDKVLMGAKFIETGLCYNNPSHKKIAADKQEQHNLFKSEVCESKRSDIEKRGKDLYGDNFNSENIFQKLEKFKAFKNNNKNCTVRHEERLSGMADYLAGWFCTDIVAIRNGYQPYADRVDTGVVIPEILSVTKTQDTQDVMSLWKLAITRNKSIKRY